MSLQAYDENDLITLKKSKKCENCDLTYTNLSKLYKVNFMNTNVSGMNFAKFNLTKGNFINSITCDTIFPCSKDIENVR